MTRWSRRATAMAFTLRVHAAVRCLKVNSSARRSDHEARRGLLMPWSEVHRTKYKTSPQFCGSSRAEPVRFDTQPSTAEPLAIYFGICVNEREQTARTRFDS